MTETSALTGVRILELAHYIAGPQACQILADHGADVVKIEPPGGEPGRRARPLKDDESLYFASHNRGKRSIELDLRTEAGREVLADLVGWADALVTNYAKGVPERLGFGFEQVQRLNPELVMVHITGFGQSGPYADWVAFDGIVQAMSGLAHVTGQPGGPPTLAGPYIGDHVAAMQGAMGCVLGLQARTHGQGGQLVDVSMLDGLLSTMGHHMAQVDLGEPEPGRLGNSPVGVFSDTFATTDGWVYLAPVTLGMWERLCDVVGHPEWWQEELAEPGWRIQHKERLTRELASWTAERTRRQVVDAMQAQGIVCGPVNAVSDLLADAQLDHRGMLAPLDLGGGLAVTLPGVPVRLSATPARRNTSRPEVGEHSAELLEGALGYRDEQLERARSVTRGQEE